MKRIKIKTENLAINIINSTIILKNGNVNLCANLPEKTEDFLDVLEKLLKESEELNHEV